MTIPPSTRRSGRPPAGPMTELMIALEERLRRVTLASDVDALDALLSDQLLLTDASGRLLSKLHYLEALRLGRLKFESMVTSQQHIHFVAAVVLVSAHMALEGRYGELRLSGEHRCTRVWAPEGGGSGCWRVVASHTSRIEA